MTNRQAEETVLDTLENPHQAALNRIWEQRAKLLAHVPEQKNTDQNMDFVFVRMGREVYAFDVQYIFEIQLGKQITFVPRVPNWVIGITNLSGHIFSVISLQKFFNLPAEEDGNLAKMKYLVTTRTKQLEIALLVDDVLGVQSIASDRIQEQDQRTQKYIPTDYIMGVIQDHTQEKQMLVTILNLSILLSDERLIIRHELD